MAMHAKRMDQFRGSSVTLAYGMPRHQRASADVSDFPTAHDAQDGHAECASA